MKVLQSICKRGDSRKNKEDKNKQNNDKKDQERLEDKELDVLLREWGALKTEILSRLQAQYQLTNVALLLLGGFAAILTAPVVAATKGINLAVPSYYIVFLLLLAAPLFSSLLHVFLSHQLDLGLFGNYLEKCTRRRICELLEVKDRKKEDRENFLSKENFLSWERYHQHALDRWLGPLASTMITTSHAGVVAMLALLTLVFAIWAYVVNFPLFTENVSRWISLGILIFDIVYFLASIPVGVATVKIFTQIPKDYRSMHVDTLRKVAKKTPEAEEELFRRAVQVIMDYNSQSKKSEARRFINDAVVAHLVAGKEDIKQTHIKKYLDDHQAEIAAHHTQYRVSSKINDNHTITSQRESRRL